MINKKISELYISKCDNFVQYTLQIGKEYAVILY